MSYIEHQNVHNYNNNRYSSYSTFDEKTNPNWRQPQHARPKYEFASYNNLSQINIIYDNSINEGEKDDDLESCYSIQTNILRPIDRNHRYNTPNNKYTTPCYSADNYNKHNDKKDKVRIKTEWKQIVYDPNDKQLKDKIAQIIKYGSISSKPNTFTSTEHLIHYGTRILHTNIYGDIIGLYHGGIYEFMQWFYWFILNNIDYDLHKVFARNDLFKLSMICGVDLCKNEKFGYEIIQRICQRGWLQGLRWLIEKLHINHVNNKFELLVDIVYSFHDDILQYLLIENDFYKYFDIDGKQNKYGETLWMASTKHFKEILQPGSGWLHCLECLHFAPYLINEIHENIADDDEKNYVKEKNQTSEDANNWMIQQLDGISLDIQTIELPKEIINERLQLIEELINTNIQKQSIQFKLESCYYGLCAAAAHNTATCIHFYKSYIVTEDGDCDFFEYIPCENNWGRLRMSVSDTLWLTVSSDKNMVKLCPIKADDSQLWTIKQIELEYTDKIWIQIINKLGCKLIFSWTPTVHSSMSSMPKLSVSNKINEIDPLCIDLFSVAKSNYTTTCHVYHSKYKFNNSKQKAEIRKGIDGLLSRTSFWRLPVDGSKFYPTKFMCYKQKLKHIAQIIWEFKQRYISSITTTTTTIKTKRESPPPPPTQQIVQHQYTLKDIACPDCQWNAVRCRKYWMNICEYGHATKSDYINGSKLFCEYGYGCSKPSKCNRKHHFDGNTNTLKCPWKYRKGYCINSKRNLCPYFHDDKIDNNPIIPCNSYRNIQ